MLATSIDQRLLQNSTWLWDTTLCHFYLKHEKNWPWLVLIPDRLNLREIDELPHQDQQQLIREITWSSKALKQLFSPDKINIGALGNIVPQLHIHVLGRYNNPVKDPAWPGPVWGYPSTILSEAGEIQKRVQKLAAYRQENPLS